MSELPIIIIVEEGADLVDVKAQCEQHGVTGVASLPRLRVLKGHVEATRLSELRQLPGVASVEAERRPRAQ